MADESLQNPGPRAERRPAVWPWLLIPLVTLALFLALRNIRENTEPTVQDAPDESSVATDPRRR